MGDKVDAAFPPGFNLAWGLTERPRRGPKPELSLDTIVEAAINIADEGGLAAVSMSKVAAALGFTTMSLYRYVDSKDALLLLMQEGVLAASLPSDPPPARWREGIRQWAKALLKIYKSHPWVGDIPISGPPMTPNYLALVDWCLGSMQKMLLTDQEKMATLLLVSGYVRSESDLQRDLSRARQAGGSDGAAYGADYADALKQLVSQERFPFLYPIVRSGAYTDDDPDDVPQGDDAQFVFGLERILDGLEVLIAKREAAEA